MTQDDDPLKDVRGRTGDERGRYYEKMYRRGEQLESKLPWKPRRWNWLNDFAKRQPAAGSALQGLFFGLMFLPILFLFGLIADLPYILVLGLDLTAVVFFAIRMYGYNTYVSRHGEPWGETPPT